MKKNLTLTLCFLLVSIVSFAGKFILIPVTETDNLESFFNNNDLKIHYYCDKYILATTDIMPNDNISVLDENAFEEVNAYAIVYCYNHYKKEYLSNISKSNQVLYSGDNFLIMKILSNDFMPAKNDGIVFITDVEAKLPKSQFDFPVITDADNNIQHFLSKVKTDSLIAYVQHLQDYGTRAYDEPQAYQAQAWLQAKFEAMGLETETQSFHPYQGVYWGWTYYPHSNSSENVIAIQKGTKYPDEYIVCGAHYDTFSWYPITPTVAPGADDNATGTASILEMARVLSQFEFERSIIYCCFSAEEFGLWGSDAYATRCKQDDVNIVGVFNIDMSGYLSSGDPMHISLIYPSPAAPLANFFLNVADIYYENIPITSYANLSGGDSDHTSFNQNGYMGIWTFEDWKDDSPYIHSPADIIGPSVNHPEQVKMFAQINLAGIATLAGFDSDTALHSIPSPINCITEYDENAGGISMKWDYYGVKQSVEYYVYKDGFKIAQTTELSYIDVVDDYFTHCYMVTAAENCGDELLESAFSNESCISKPFGIKEFNSNYKIFPNPTTGELQVTSDKLQVTSIEIYDIYGRAITTHCSLLTTHYSINVSHLPAGIYFIKIGDEFVGKFVKE
ncbi:MAG: M28 family peptidase [Bacteroidales bacterium]|jgi:hypothetical protein|nr:M28 family peptidase [Bacteroidales bacterium]